MEKMTGMTLEAVTEAVSGVYYGPDEGKQITLSAITIDSRTVEKDCLFVAIKGARVDGNRFVPGAYADGAACCMSTKPPGREDVPYIQVESCEQALKDMAEYYRSILDVKVVGITGSVGKTTTKEMIAAVVAQKYDTLKTLGNFNNEIGLPLTVFRLRPHHQVAILEMGISEFGEMGRLAKVAKPDYCVITNIGQCHLENLGTRDGILKAKTEMLDYVKPGAVGYFNGDDDKLCNLKEDNRVQTIYYGFGENIQNPSVTVKNVKNLGLAGSEVDIVTPKGNVHMVIPAPGKHMISNAMAAAAVGVGLGLELDQIKKGIESYEPVGGHGHIIRTDTLTIMDDCYNANPVSMKAGLDVLADMEGRRVAILGDMFELGTEEKQMHYDVGVHAAGRGIEQIIAIGQLAQEYVKGAKAAGKEDVLYFETLDEGLAQLERVIQKGDAVMVKASHAMHFEKVVEKLKEFIS